MNNRVKVKKSYSVWQVSVGLSSLPTEHEPRARLQQTGRGKTYSDCFTISANKYLVYLHKFSVIINYIVIVFSS